MDLFVSIIFIATQTLYFLFRRHRVNVKEYTQANQDIGTSFIKEFWDKTQVYPPTLMVTILFMIMVILDGGFFLGKVKELVSYIYVLTLYYYTKATGANTKHLLADKYCIGYDEKRRQKRTGKPALFFFLKKKILFCHLRHLRHHNNLHNTQVDKHTYLNIPLFVIFVSSLSFLTRALLVLQHYFWIC
ncbi:MAG: hypothetical protein CM1200mP10_05440 [Candidatus Neomarinimicrobiota bacterium]|nr:MAG: hypothetical protein CM1200mP10_05440 [Candidatus Neomarinimicrobiota bacterium]